MEYNVWEENFKKPEIKFPNEIAREMCNQLYSVTDKKVMAKVEKYKENFFDMNKSAPYMGLTAMDNFLKSRRIQDNLGEVSGNDKFTYELYLTGVKTVDYKYRFCFIENGVYPYPVKIALDAEIAKELEASTIIECKDEEEYVISLKKILTSKKMKGVIEGLMAINS